MDRTRQVWDILSAESIQHPIGSDGCATAFRPAHLVHAAAATDARRRSCIGSRQHAPLEVLRSWICLNSRGDCDAAKIKQAAVTVIRCPASVHVDLVRTVGERGDQISTVKVAVELGLVEPGSLDVLNALHAVI